MLGSKVWKVLVTDNKSAATRVDLQKETVDL
jgi:hypothetical protein